MISRFLYTFLLSQLLKQFPNLPSQIPRQFRVDLLLASTPLQAESVPLLRVPVDGRGTLFVDAERGRFSSFLLIGQGSELQMIKEVFANGDLSVVRRLDLATGKCTHEKIDQTRNDLLDGFTSVGQDEWMLRGGSSSYERCRRYSKQTKWKSHYGKVNLRMTYWHRLGPTLIDVAQCFAPFPPSGTSDRLFDRSFETTPSGILGAQGRQLDYGEPFRFQVEFVVLDKRLILLIDMECMVPLNMDRDYDEKYVFGLPEDCY